MRRNALPLGIFILSALLTSHGVWAQESEGREIENADVKLDAREDLSDMRWGFAEKKGFMVHPNPRLGGPVPGLTSFFTMDSFDSVMSWSLPNLGAGGFLTIFLFGNEDLASGRV